MDESISHSGTSYYFDRTCLRLAMVAIINSVVSLTATLVIGVDVQLSVGRFI